LEDYAIGNLKILNLHNKSNKCLLFCSGNGLYFPNTIEEYVKKIRIENRYEWENIARNKIIQKNVAKIIFIRDIFKQWYVTGINKDINNIDKLAEYLKNETNEYEVTIVGNSAGGYIAVLIGILIKANIILTVCGQYNLYDFVDKEPLLNKYKNNLQCSKYYDLRKLIKKATEIIYFVPINCEIDMPQYGAVEKYKNIKTLKFNSKSHGLGEICGENFPYLLTYNKREIEVLYFKYKDKIMNPWLFFVEKKIIFFQIIRILKKIIGKFKIIIFRKHPTMQCLDRTT
jgi:hypothetical protein